MVGAAEVGHTAGGAEGHVIGTGLVGREHDVGSNVVGCLPAVR